MIEYGIFLVDKNDKKFFYRSARNDKELLAILESNIFKELKKNYKSIETVAIHVDAPESK